MFKSLSCCKVDDGDLEHDVMGEEQAHGDETPLTKPLLPGELTESQSKRAHDVLRKMQALDESTKIPFILIELRGEGNGQGAIEVCGKDEYGVYAALQNFFVAEWDCTELDVGCLRDDTPLPFSEKAYTWPRYKCMQTAVLRQCDGHPDVVIRKTPSGKFLAKVPNGTVVNILIETAGEVRVQTPTGMKGWIKRSNMQFSESDDSEGTSNMGLYTMHLIDFMCNKQSWTLGTINGGNIGQFGEIREQQVIFKAPHPMNLVVPHVMIELRSVGFIEVCGCKESKAFLDQLEAYLQQEFKATRVKGHEEYCDRFYKCADGVFRERGKLGENNMGLLTVKLCDFVGKGKPWSLVTINGGNYGESGSHREQQMVFRLDNHPLGEEPHLMVELREAGFVEINGDDTDGIYGKLDSWLKGAPWTCADFNLGKDAFCHKKYKWAKGKSRNFMLATAEIVEFFQQQGWCLQLCSMGSPEVSGDTDSFEQQIIFRPGGSKVDVIEPHIVMELHMGDGREGLYKMPEKTQLLQNQSINIYPIGDCIAAIDQFHEFMIEYLGGQPSPEVPTQYNCEVFMSRGLTENNLGFWTMRICDFMVDRLGWSFVVCNVNNLGKLGELRVQQMIFRFDGGRRNIPVTMESTLFAASATYAGFETPDYWVLPEVLEGKSLHGLHECDSKETADLQQLLDQTFRRITTRNRVYVPFRLEVVHAFRSENVPLTYRFRKRREKYKGGPSSVKAKTLDNCKLLNGRLGEGEALLFHGTNPSSSINILKGGFSLDHSGASSGTLFGDGIYLAECCSKSDEYARDDTGGTYPGLRCMVVCHCLIGDPMVVTNNTDCIREARDSGKDCVLADREAKAGTYKEFIFFDEAQVIPEYSVIYKRQFKETKVPVAMRVKIVNGTEGKFWQVKVGESSHTCEEGWQNIPGATSQKLIEAANTGQTIVSIPINGVAYTYDLEKLTRTNKVTGDVHELRGPEKILERSEKSTGALPN